MSVIQTASTAREHRIPRLRAPIVLVHGLLGFDSLRVGPWLVAHYFQGIPEPLCAAGNRVLVASLSPTRCIADRAAQLKALLDRESPREPVHLIAHSMGGLDSRYLISRLAMADRVLTLTTLGTPHRGSSFADWASGRLVRLVGRLPVEERLQPGGADGDAGGRRQARHEDAVAAGHQHVGDVAPVAHEGGAGDVQAAVAEDAVDQDDGVTESRDLHACFLACEPPG